jgi:hypothetical protein
MACLPNFRLPASLLNLVVVVAACGGSGRPTGEPSGPNPTAIIIQPDSVTLSPGASQAFQARAQMSDGSVASIAATWSATGGTITTGGLYTAGDVAGTYRVAATATSGSLADTASVVVEASGSATYSTTFPLDENLLSEGGHWHHVDPLLTVCQSLRGRAFGTQTGANGYDDSNAYLTGFGSDYEVSGIVWINPALSGGANREVEIVLRWTDDGPLRSTPYGDTHANGYEINVQHAGAYMQLGRFKGALLAEVHNYAVPHTGDRFRARIEGQRIRVWWNDVLKIDHTDTDPTLQVPTGNPGIGFYVSSGAPNTDFGFDSVSVTALGPLPQKLDQRDRPNSGNARLIHSVVAELQR